MLGDVLKLQQDIANAPIVDAETLKMLDEYNDKIDKMIAKFKVAVAQYFRLVEIIEKYTPQGIVIKYVRDKFLGTEEAPQPAAQAPEKQADTAKKVIDSLKKPDKDKEPKKEKEKAADTKSIETTATSVSGNVIGVGQNPVISPSASRSSWRNSNATTSPSSRRRVSPRTPRATSPTKAERPTPLRPRNLNRLKPHGPRLNRQRPDH
jgi:hypothetical protein